MNEKKLKETIEEIEQNEGNYSTEKMINQMAKLMKKLFIPILNEFNESTNRYSSRLFWLTLVIAVLTLVLVIKTFAP